jgi:hypothetical protein
MKESWKYVSFFNCFKIIITCLVFACVALIPFYFTDNGIVLTYKLLPYVGDGSLTGTVIGTWLTEATITMIPAIASLKAVFDIIFSFCVYAYFAIIAADIVFALLLILTRSRILRFLIRILSLIMAIASLVIALSFLAYIVITVSTQIHAIGLMPTLKETGLLSALGFFIFSVGLTARQFKWFRKPFPLRFYKKDRELSSIMK